jgi:thioredoxin 1
MANANVLELTETNFQDQVLSSNQPVLVDVFADWCQPCRMLAPKIQEIAGEYQGKAVVGKLDIEAARSIGEKYNITALPTVLVFKDGQVKKTLVGYKPKSEYAAALNELL